MTSTLRNLNILTRHAPRLDLNPKFPHGPTNNIHVQQFIDLTPPHYLSRQFFSKMSWMDSWSRPSKSQATPPPLYLTFPDTPYCHTCGRVIGERKKHAGQEVKYCSARCRSHKPRAIDRKIESVFAALLEGADPESLKEKDGEGDGESDAQGHGGPVVGGDGGGRNGHAKGKGGKKEKGKKVKGDSRIIVECSTVEDIVFPHAKDPSKTFGRRKNRAARGTADDYDNWKSVDMEDEPPNPPPTRPSNINDKGQASSQESDSESDHAAPTLDHTLTPQSQNQDHTDEVKPLYGYGGGKIRPPQSSSDINGSIGGEKGWAERIHETPEMLAKRKEGERRAEEKEMVRRAARRGVAFGFDISGGGEDGEKRKCEAVMKGVVVESSFAKGEWGVRWREKV